MAGITICSWNINSVRLREPLVLKLLAEMQPDVLCLQECKSPVDLMPRVSFAELGYCHMVANGQKGYNGVLILSRLPLKNEVIYDFANLGHARHIGITVDNRLQLHNFYVPAGGDIPDRIKNKKFGQKLDYLNDMKLYFTAQRPLKSVLVGDLNIAPRPDDVWDHKKLLNVVSHTPIEVDALAEVQNAGHWVDVARQDMAEGKLYSWWSYRARDWDLADKGRRLDHIWASDDIAMRAHSSIILRAARGWEKPSDHAPVFASFDL